MNDKEFKEYLSINKRDIIDNEIIFGLDREVEKYLEEEKKKENVTNVEQIANRKEVIDKIFLNYDYSMEIINQRKNFWIRTSKMQNVEPNEVDKKLRKIIKKVGEEIYSKKLSQEAKVIVIDRTTSTIELLRNFEDNLKYLRFKEKVTTAKESEGR